jgi:hypothetical protein
MEVKERVLELVQNCTDPEKIRVVYAFLENYLTEGEKKNG